MLTKTKVPAAAPAAPTIKAFQGEEHAGFRLTITGGKSAALLIHGFPGTPHEMRPLANALHQHGWTSDAMLLPGFGADIETLPERTYTDWMSAIQRKVHDLRQTHDTVILVGHSMGGALALATAAQNRVNGVIALAPFYRIPHIAWQLLPVLRVIFPQIKPFHLVKLDFNNPETRAGILNFMPDIDLDDPETQAAVKEFAIPVKMINQIRICGINTYRLAPSIKCPILVIQGTNDELVRPAITQELVKQFDTAAHYVTVDGEHDLINDQRPAWDKITHDVLHFAKSAIKASI